MKGIQNLLQASKLSFSADLNGPLLAALQVKNYSNVLKCEYIIQPFCRTQLFANDFFNRCVSCFNGLPESVVSSNTVVEFKHRLSEVDLSFFKSTILIIVLVICSGYANNPVYTINLSMYLYHFILYVFALVFKFMNERLNE